MDGDGVGESRLNQGDGAVEGIPPRFQAADWIGWTKCRTCGHTEKDVFQRSDDAPQLDTPALVRCSQCGNPAKYITFPAFEVQTFEISGPGDAMYDTIDDW